MSQMSDQRSDYACVLVMDEDEQALRELGRTLTQAGFDWVPATAVEEATDRLRERDFALVLASVGSREESGLQLVREVLANHQDVAAVLLGENDDAEAAHEALEVGVYGYIFKPFTPNEVLIAVSNALRRRELEVENRAQRETLQEIVRVRTAALERSAQQLKLTREETVRRLARAVEYRDEETGNHTERMSRYCALMSRRTGLDPESIRVASALHDVGKVAVPDNVLLKPGRLTDIERREMERHTEVGWEILHGSGSSLLDLAALIAWTHHEKYDGSGYPRGLSGHEIPIEGRMVAVADVFDALTTHRSYRPAFTLEQTIEMMRGERGKHFDPDLLDFFLGSMDEVLEIMRAYPDPTLEPVGA
jgi:putative two-component system response regulator